MFKVQLYTVVPHYNVFHLSRPCRFANLFCAISNKNYVDETFCTQKAEEDADHCTKKLDFGKD